MGGNNAGYDVSVVVCTYHSLWQKLVLTIDSILQSEGCTFEIVITDDGSDRNHFDELRKYFADKNFSEYRLISHEKNRGTVTNILDGVLHSGGYWIKPISPGDCLLNKDTLSNWIGFCTQNASEWSFGEAVFYCPATNEESASIDVHDCPIDLAPYKRGDVNQCRWNYFVLSDFVIGANTLCKRSQMLKYLGEIEGRVKFGEDNIYRLMMFDGVAGKYYPVKTIKYEYGSGISTSGNKTWGERIHKDIVETNRILADRKTEDEYQITLRNSYNRWFHASGIRKRLIYMLYHGGLKIFLMRKFPVIRKLFDDR